MPSTKALSGPIDEAELLGGYRVDFHGVKMGWVGEMIVKDLMDPFHNAYLPCLIQCFTNWIYHVGKPVHILRNPEGTTWVMQEYTKNVDPTLTTTQRGTGRGTNANPGLRPPCRPLAPRSSPLPATRHNRDHGQAH